MKKREFLSIRKEILSIFLVFTIIIMMVSLMMYNKNITELRKADIDYLTESCRQLSYSADDIIMDMNVLFNIQYVDQKFRSIILNKKQEFDERTRFQNTTYIENILNHTVSKSRYVLRCTLFTEKGDIYSNISYISQDYKDYIQKIISQDKIGRDIYYTDLNQWNIELADREVVTAIKALYDYYGTSPLAWVVMDISYEKMDNFLKSEDTDTGTILLCGNRMLYADTKKGVSKTDLDSIQKTVLQMADRKEEQQIKRINGVNYLITTCSSSNTGWIVARYVAERKALYSVIRKRNQGYILLLFTFMIVFIIYYVRITQMILPLLKLDKVVRGNKGESLQKVYPDSGERWKTGRNEISNVIESYNDMVDRVNDYAEKTLRNEIMRKEIQLKMLTYQINPHFLYNTLNTISAMAEIENMDNIVKITDSISNLFRYSLKEEVQVSLWEELEHVKDYVQIQMFRFPDRFQVFYEIPKYLQEVKVMKFILQPLVENSITHGFFNKTSKGKIVISVLENKEQSMLELIVSDNGEGIKPELLKKINQKLSDYRLDKNGQENIGADGIGIMNVNARIVGYYGAGSGITLYSEYGKGTKVSLKIRYKGVRVEGINCGG